MESESLGKGCTANGGKAGRLTMREGKSFIPAIAEQPKKSTNYSAAETAEIRTGAIKKAIGAQLDILMKSAKRIDLHDLSSVKEVTEHYIEKCGSAGICPNYEGLCAALGISRKWGYEFCRKHKSEESAEYLNGIRLAMASLRMSLAESRVLDNATSIFILKNSGLGFVDKAEYEITEPTSPLDDLDADAAWTNLAERILMNKPNYHERQKQKLIESIPEEDD